EVKIIITVKKFKITIVGNEEERKVNYKWIREEMYNQFRGLNALMSFFTSKTLLEQFEGSNEYKLKTEVKKLENKIKESKNKSNIELDELKQNLEKLLNDYYIEKQNRTNYADKFHEVFLKNDYQLLSQLPFQYSYTKSLIHNRVKEDFKILCKKGFLSGKCKAINYKLTYPLMIQAKDLKFDFSDSKGNVFINYVFGIKFKIVNPSKKRYNNFIELQSILNNIKNGTYIPKQSSIQFDYNKLILNLTLDIPEKQESEKMLGRIMGIDLGVKIPAYCALNNNPDIKKWIGNFDDFMRVSQQIKKRRSSLQSSLTHTKGGHGRKKKLQALERFKEKQSNYNKTYNEWISAEIIKFAIKHKVEQINLEFLTLQKEKGRSMLKDWPYYQLGQMIKRKAKAVGIIVKFVDPYHTSQICNVCGHYEKGQREKQAEFICKSCGIKLNADYNAARNIAKSTKYIESKEESEWFQKYIVNKNNIE
ncbi:MAG: transposase, partial [archaeon]